jgi:hypothetical protein
VQRDLGSIRDLLAMTLRLTGQDRSAVDAQAYARQAVSAVDVAISLDA